MSLIADTNYPSGSSPNFGWNLGAPAPVPMPQPYSQPTYNNPDDSGEPGVEENAFQARNAGAMSFAHYIIHTVCKSFTKPA